MEITVCMPNNSQHTTTMNTHILNTVLGSGYSG